MTLAARILGVLSLFVWLYPQMTWAQSEKAKLRVMTFNTLYGGTKRGQPLTQTAQVILKSQAERGIYVTPLNAKADDLARFRLVGVSHDLQLAKKSRDSAGRALLGQATHAFIRIARWSHVNTPTG